MSDGADGEKKEEVPEAEKVKLPVIDKPKLILQNDTGMCWIGLPLSKMEILEAFCALDFMKSQLYGWYFNQRTKVKIQKVSAISSMKNFVANKFK